ncbi:leucine-rich repeat-containing protein 34 [Aulostomus maculatus]
MVSKSISKVYASICAQHQIQIKTQVLEVLEKTALTETNSLTLSGNTRWRLDDKDALVLSKCLFNKPSVTGLDVGYNNITDEGAGYLAVLLQEEDSSLLRLDLTFNDIEASGAQVLAKSLQRNSSLVCLQLSCNKMGNDGALQLAAMLQVNHTLEELELADCGLLLQGVIALASALKSNSTLRSIDLSRPLLFSLQEEWAVHVSDMLALNHSLVELHLGRMVMTDTGMEKLTQGLQRNRSLRYLDLRCNRVTCDGVRYLAKALKNNPTLEIIDLSSNQIKDEGAAHLSKALTSPGCSLRELSVCSNDLRAEGLLSLAQAVNANASLTHIYIWGNFLDVTVCKAFNHLISSGRLPPEHTDVSPFQVDGQVFLARVFHSLRRHYDGRACWDPHAADASPPPPSTLD